MHGLRPTRICSVVGICFLLPWTAGCGTELDTNSEIIELQSGISATLNTSAVHDTDAGDGSLTKVTLTLDVLAGARPPPNCLQARISTSCAAELVHAERGAALAGGDILLEKEPGDPCPTVTITFNAARPLASGPVAELTYRLREGVPGDSGLRVSLITSAPDGRSGTVETNEGIPEVPGGTIETNEGIPEIPGQK